jgi:hypothetical protein
VTRRFTLAAFGAALATVVGVVVYLIDTYDTMTGKGRR